MTRRSCGCQSKEFIDQCIITEIIGTQGRIEFPVKVFVGKKPYHHRRDDDVDNVKIKNRKAKYTRARNILYMDVPGKTSQEK